MRIVAWMGCKTNATIYIASAHGMPPLILTVFACSR